MVLLLLACFDYHIVSWEGRADTEDSTIDAAERPPLGGAGDSDDEEDEGTGNGGGNNGGNNGGGNNNGNGDDEDPDAEDGQDSSTPPGQTEDDPRKPAPGEVVISELMVDPDAVHDKFGEYVELTNVTPAWLTLEGVTLSDDNIDKVVLPALVLPPHGTLVLCASDDTWDNGGVVCDWDYEYDSLGDGFAMSNEEDEVILTKPNGKLLDKVVWRDPEWAVVGASMGLDPDEMDVDANDALDAWCDQWPYLSGGDSGTPGEENDWCW